MTTEQTALQRIKEVCEGHPSSRWVANIGYRRIIEHGTYICSRKTPAKDYIAVDISILCALIELCEAYEAEMTDYWHGKVMNNDRSKAALVRLEEVCPK